MKQANPLKTQHGFSFLELSLVLAILAVSAVAAQQIVLARAEQKIVEQSVDGLIKVTEAVYAHYADSPPAARTWPPTGNVQRTDWSAWEDYLPVDFADPENYWFERTHETAGDTTTRIVGGIVSRRMGTAEQARAVSAALGTDYCGPSACTGQRLAILNLASGNFPASHSFGQPGSDDAIEQTLTSPEFQTLVLERNPDFVSELVDKLKEDDDFMAELKGDDGDKGDDGKDGNDGNNGGNGNSGNKPSLPQPKTTCRYNGAERVSGWSYYRWSGRCNSKTCQTYGDGNCMTLTFNGTESGTQYTCRSGSWASAARTRGCTHRCTECRGSGK